MKGDLNARRPHFCGCGLLENVADLVIQRCRRTRRDPSSSSERRRKVARSWVRVKIMRQAHTAERQAVSSVSESADASMKIVLVGTFDPGGDDLADPQRTPAGDINRAVDLRGVRLGAAF
jgi:hypothetical protein